MKLLALTHRLRDDLVIIVHDIAIHRFDKRPSRRLVLKVVQNHLEKRMMGIALGLADAVWSTSILSIEWRSTFGVEGGRQRLQRVRRAWGDTHIASSSGFQPLSAKPGTSSFDRLTVSPGLRFLNASSPGWTICEREIVRILARIA